MLTHGVDQEAREQDAAVANAVVYRRAARSQGLLLSGARRATVVVGRWPCERAASCDRDLRERSPEYDGRARDHPRPSADPARGAKDLALRRRVSIERPARNAMSIRFRMKDQSVFEIPVTRRGASI